MSPTHTTKRGLRARSLVLLALMLLALGACGRPKAITAPTWEPPAMPDTPAGRQVAGYLQAFNAGDKEGLAAFVAGHMTPAGPSAGRLRTGSAAPSSCTRPAAA